MKTELARSIAEPCNAPAAAPDGGDTADAERLREWIVTNALGGYASCTVCGLPTRRYHGVLIAALPAPLGRMMMLSQLNERLLLPDGSSVPIASEALAGRPMLSAAGQIAEFRLEAGLPVWRYKAAGAVLEKRLVLPHLQNTAYVTYRLVSREGAAAAEGRPLQLVLRPLVHFRSHDAAVDSRHPGTYRFTASGDRYEICASQDNIPPLRMTLLGRNPAFTLDAAQSAEITFRLEAQRGYESSGDQWSPGYFHAEFSNADPVTLVASVESWETLTAMTPDEAIRAELGRRARLVFAARRAAAGEPVFGADVPPYSEPARVLSGFEPDAAFAAELVLAADAFVITPAGRVEDAARAHASGEEVRTVIAGYHWFTDWGRDTMISLEGLTLTTGRAAEAGYILRTFAHYIRDGLIPNMFPEGKTDGLYHTADATLWFFHAIDRYTEVTDERGTVLSLLPRLIDIVDHHLKGTRFGIGVDPSDGLLRQGAPGYQLTWMDAKVGDWVVTPRRGKAVEINALWYNALKLLAGWLREARGDDAAAPYEDHAERARRSFNERFWYELGGYLYDVVDGETGDDPACRPNQLFAFSLPHPALDESRWPAVLDVVRERLLTPVGLRSLAPGHPDYKSHYFGDLRARDAAYHQGTAWAWLIGPFVDAWLRVHPDDLAGARRFLEGFRQHLGEAGLGTISEIFDAEPPYTPRGCIAQAWSVAEVLRSWVKTGGLPAHGTPFNGRSAAREESPATATTSP